MEVKVTVRGTSGHQRRSTRGGGQGRHEVSQVEEAREDAQEKTATVLLNHLENERSCAERAKDEAMEHVNTRNAFPHRHFLPRAKARSTAPVRYTLDSHTANTRTDARADGRTRHTSLIRKYRVASTPYRATRSSGSMTLPVLLEIFWPSLVHQPCTNSRLGGSRPAASRRAGQYTEWNRRMSLPITWRSAGQNLIRFFGRG